VLHFRQQHPLPDRLTRMIEVSRRKSVIALDYLGQRARDRGVGGIGREAAKTTIANPNKTPPGIETSFTINYIRIIEYN
jgi:hypothetical protein